MRNCLGILGVFLFTYENDVQNMLGNFPYRVLGLGILI